MNVDSLEIRRIASVAPRDPGQLPLQLGLLCASCSSISETQPRMPLASLRETDWGQTPDGQTDLWFYSCRSCGAVWFQQMNLITRESTWELREIASDRNLTA